MPIEGLSDARRLPRVGKIRLGVKVETGQASEHPKAVDYFVCPVEVQEQFGERPTSLPILLPAQEIEGNLRLDLKRYGMSRGLICKGDGLTAGAVNPDTGEISDIPCPYKGCEWYLKGQCKEIGILSFLLPDVPGFGVWQIATSSYNTILNLQSEMAFAKLICGGRLAGLPLDLTLESQQAQVKGKRKTIYVLHLRSRLKLHDLRSIPAFEPITAAAIPSSDDIPDDLYAANNENGVSENMVPLEHPKEAQGPIGGKIAGESAYGEQRQKLHAEVAKCGLTLGGYNLWLSNEYHVSSCTELDQEQTLAAIAAVRALSNEQVEEYNRVEVSRGMVNGGNDVKRGLKVQRIRELLAERAVLEPAFKLKSIVFASIRKLFPAVKATSTPDLDVKEWLEKASLHDLNVYGKHLQDAIQSAKGKLEKEQASDGSL